MHFPWRKIWFERFALCKRYDILKLCNKLCVKFLSALIVQGLKASFNQNVWQSSFVNVWLNLASDILPKKDVPPFIASFWEKKNYSSDECAPGKCSFPAIIASRVKQREVSLFSLYKKSVVAKNIVKLVTCLKVKFTRVHDKLFLCPDFCFDE